MLIATLVWLMSATRMGMAFDRAHAALPQQAGAADGKAPLGGANNAFILMLCFRRAPSDALILYSTLG